jgi:hypothetical protein
MEMEFPPEQRGTRLPNARVVVLRSERVVETEGVYIWTSGWVTVYSDPTNNRGSIYPQHEIVRIDFGTPSED